MSASLILVVSVLVLALVLPCPAQQAADRGGERIAAAAAEEPVETPGEEAFLKVTATVCTEIAEREPIGAGETFPVTVEKLYCHTLVEGAQDSTSITHIWYYGDRMMAEVPLAVNSIRWRTWSSKRMMESWVGTWRVDILDENGTVLVSTTFQLE